MHDYSYFWTPVLLGIFVFLIALGLNDDAKNWRERWQMALMAFFVPPVILWGMTFLFWVFQA